MLKVNFLHFCENAIVEQGSGNLSMIGVFENINAQSFPAVHPVMAIVAGFEADAGMYGTELVFLDEKAEILRIPAEVNIGPNGRGNWIYKIVGYQIPRELTQKVKLNYKGETVYTGYLTINNK
jgi:hypothetical protein